MLQVPFTPTALRLYREYIEQLEAHAEAIRAESGAPEYIALPETVVTLAEVAEELAELADATDMAPAPAAPPAPPAPVAQPEPEPVYELQPTAKCADSGYTLAQYRDNGWSDEQLEANGLATWVEVEAPFTDAPGVSVAPPPPPAAAAPAAPSTSGAVELDKSGLPWDARIHSDAAEKLSQKGLWKRKRGVSDELVAQVEAELRLATSPKPTPTAAQAAPVPPVASGGSGPQNFAELSVYIASLLKAGKIDQTHTVAAVQSVGLNILPDLAAPANAVHIPAVVQHLRAAAGI